ncbi:hypothetical protein [Paenibacillus sp. NRS-1760]|uniref:hypothetical protein n=1 Tax=Paenibacillus sp. NRS-1760 TaxID=3233902 RepID=UPI003D2A16A8
MKADEHSPPTKQVGNVKVSSLVKLNTASMIQLSFDSQLQYQKLITAGTSLLLRHRSAIKREGILPLPSLLLIISWDSIELTIVPYLKINRLCVYVLFNLG